MERSGDRERWEHESVQDRREWQGVRELVRGRIVANEKNEREYVQAGNLQAKRAIHRAQDKPNAGKL